MKVCPEPGCPVLIPRTARYCPTHARTYEARRGTSTQRGYGAAHQRLRAVWARRLARGEVIPCARCGLPIDPGQPWDLGHSDDRKSWTGPEHANQCNRAAGGRKGAEVRNSSTS